jgi:uncharacterized protein
MNRTLSNLMVAMAEYDHGDAMRIQHFVKVHDFALTIGTLEGLDEQTLFILEAAALVHDIGIHASEAKYGNSHGKHQEELGPDEARKLLSSLNGFSNEVIERVCYLVGHHHTYTDIDSIDYQILVEADFLVNIYEDNVSQNGALHAKKNIFKTETGKRLFDAQYSGKTRTNIICDNK